MLSIYNQKWICEVSNGWLGFKNGSKYLGFDNYEKLRCSATSQSKWEHFVVRKHPDGAYMVFLRKDDGLRPLGKNSDRNLAMVSSTDMKWEFTKV